MASRISRPRTSAEEHRTRRRQNGGVVREKAHCCDGRQVALYLRSLRSTPRNDELADPAATDGGGGGG